MEKPGCEKGIVPFQQAFLTPPVIPGKNQEVATSANVMGVQVKQ
jgi:hypothetical protein